MSSRHARANDPSAEGISMIDHIYAQRLIASRSNDGDLDLMFSDTRNLIHTKWNKGRLTEYENEETKDVLKSVCLLGAITTAREDQEGNFHASDVVIKYIERVLHEQYNYDGPISAWNDDPNRTQAEVIKVIDDAYELYKKEHNRVLV